MSLQALQSHQNVDYLFSLWLFHLNWLSGVCLCGKFFEELGTHIPTVKSRHGTIKAFDYKINRWQNIQTYYCNYSHFFCPFYLSSPFSPFFLLGRKKHNIPIIFVSSVSDRCVPDVFRVSLVLTPVYQRMDIFTRANYCSYSQN